MSANENRHKEMAQGVDTGEPDLWIYGLKDGVMHMLRLELKRKKPFGRLNDNQIEWNKWFDSVYINCGNHKRAVAYGAIDAKEIIKQWLGE